MNRAVLFLIVILLCLGSKSQIIDYDNFDYSLAEKTIFLELNRHRINNHVESVLHSKSLHTNVSTKQMNIIIDSDYIHHPDLLVYQNDFETMKKISDESESLVGVKTFKWDINKYSIQLYEIIYFINFRFRTYQELAVSCISAFHNSKTGHRHIQLKSYASKNKKGLSSCKVGLTEKGTYVLINFALVDR